MKNEKLEAPCVLFSAVSGPDLSSCVSVWLWPASTNTQKQSVTIRRLWSSTQITTPTKPIWRSQRRRWTRPVRWEEAGWEIKFPTSRQHCVYVNLSLFSQTAGLGGVDLAGLLSNPGFMNMVRSECLACNISKRSRSFGSHQNQLHSSELTANFLVSVSFKSPFLLHRTIVQMMRPHSKSLPLIYKSTKSCDFRNYFDNKQASEG